MTFAISFNATQVAPNTGGMQVHESGIYDVVLTAAPEKPVKDKPGASFAAMTMQIMTGTAKGGKIIDNLNLKNPSQQAVDIAYGQLSAYCHVTGTLHIQQSLAELFGKPFKVEITKEERDDRPGTFRNNVLRVLDVQGREPGQTNAVPGAVAQQPVVQQQTIQQPVQTQVQQPVVQQQPAVDPNAGAVQQQPATAGNNAVPSWAQ